MTASEASLVEENERQYRVLDQMLTMHAMLRDRLEARARAWSVVVLFGSVCLCGLTFADDELQLLLQLPQDQAQLLAGAAAILVFFAALIEHRLDYAKTVREHVEAVSALSSLKAEFRAAHARGEQGVAADPKELADRFNATMERIPKIPDRVFLALKQAHLFKRELSRRLDASPGAWVWLLRWRLRVEGVRKSGS